MSAATVESKSTLNPKERDWLKAMGALLDVNLDSTSTKSSTQQAAPPAGEDAKLAAKIQQIKAAVIPKVKDAVAADPSKENEITRLLEAASKQEKQSSFADAFNSFTSLVETVKAALSGVGDQVKYTLALPGAELKVKTLKNHFQTKAIAVELGKIEGYLAKAKELAGKSKYGDAYKELSKLEAEYPAAKDAADRTNKGRETEEWLRTDYNNLKLHQGIDVISADIKSIGDRIPKIDALIKGRKWGEFRTLVSDIAGDIAFYKTIANKHGDYVGLRNNAEGQIRALEAHPNKDAIKTEIAAIKKDLIDEAKKEYETNKAYEKARALLVQVEGKYNAAKKKADDGGQAAFKKAFDASSLKLKELEKPEKKNPVVDGEIAAIKSKLAKAQTIAATKQYPESMQLLAEVAKAIEGAEKLAAQQVAANGAQKAAGDSIKNIDKNANAAVEAVQKLHDQLKTHPQAMVIEFELGEVQKTIDQAKALI